MIASTAVADAFRAACRDEIEAPKPGNVHIFGAGHGMEVRDFLLSADAAAVPLSATGATVGARVLGAVEATFAAVRMNTNLGIILLCAPLAAAAEKGNSDLRAALATVLKSLDHNDAQQVFHAIARANPGGLGEAPRHDVRHPAEVALVEAMAAAAERDVIARQYASDFHDIFVTGFAALMEARQRGLKPPWLTVAVYLAFLAAFPDSHIQRKYGPAAAIAVQHEAAEMVSLFLIRREASLPDLLAFDSNLKSRKLNPGTSADLTVATLFADHLLQLLAPARQ